MTTTKRRLLAAATATSALLLLAACGSSAEPAAQKTAQSGETSAAPASGSDAFVAGDYEAEGVYQSPAGVQRVAVSLTLAADGTVTDLDVDGLASSGESAQFQKLFESGINDEVVGKSIAELDVSEVSGSSLTSGGFNAAIDDIISQAQA
ncbi:MAG TPA: FMN-binding protein [Aeromicrobium sp.]|nr:FMN-binding protein [Aeromicrobium sp.]